MSKSDESTLNFLANEMLVASDRIDAIRAREVYSPEEYQAAASSIATNLARLAAYEVVWEHLTGSRPSLLEVRQRVLDSQGA